MTNGIDMSTYLLRNEKWLGAAGTSEANGNHKTDGKLTNDEVAVFFSAGHLNGDGNDTFISKNEFESWYEANESAISAFLKDEYNMDYTTAKGLVYDALQDLVNNYLNEDYKSKEHVSADPNVNGSKNNFTDKTVTIRDINGNTTNKNVKIQNFEFDSAPVSGPIYNTVREGDDIVRYHEGKISTKDTTEDDMKKHIIYDDNGNEAQIQYSGNDGNGNYKTTTVTTEYGSFYPTVERENSINDISPDAETPAPGQKHVKEEIYDEEKDIWYINEYLVNSNGVKISGSESNFVAIPDPDGVQDDVIMTKADYDKQEQNRIDANRAREEARAAEAAEAEESTTDAPEIELSNYALQLYNSINKKGIECDADDYAKIKALYDNKNINGLEALYLYSTLYEANPTAMPKPTKGSNAGVEQITEVTKLYKNLIETTDNLEDLKLIDKIGQNLSEILMIKESDDDKRFNNYVTNYTDLAYDTYKRLAANYPVSQIEEAFKDSKIYNLENVVHNIQAKYKGSDETRKLSDLASVVSKNHPEPAEISQERKVALNNWIKQLGLSSPAKTVSSPYGEIGNPQYGYIAYGGIKRILESTTFKVDATDTAMAYPITQLTDADKYYVITQLYGSDPSMLMSCFRGVGNDDLRSPAKLICDSNLPAYKDITGTEYAQYQEKYINDFFSILTGYSF